MAALQPAGRPDDAQLSAPRNGGAGPVLYRSASAAWLYHQCTAGRGACSRTLWAPTPRSTRPSSRSTTPTAWWEAAWQLPHCLLLPALLAQPAACPPAPSPFFELKFLASPRTGCTAPLQHWVPREYIRWYIDGTLVYEVTKEALREQTNSTGGRCCWVCVHVCECVCQRAGGGRLGRGRGARLSVAPPSCRRSWQSAHVLPACFPSRPACYRCCRLHHRAAPHPCGADVRGWEGCPGGGLPWGAERVNSLPLGCGAGNSWCASIACITPQPPPTSTPCVQVHHLQSGHVWWAGGATLPAPGASFKAAITTCTATHRQRCVPAKHGRNLIRLH
jgi:hypothetical protein